MFDPTRSCGFETADLLHIDTLAGHAIDTTGHVPKVLPESNSLDTRDTVRTLDPTRDLRTLRAASYTLKLEDG
jgi:hypothetical protein